MAFIKKQIPVLLKNKLHQHILLLKISIIYFVNNGVVNKGKYYMITNDVHTNFLPIDYLENLKRLNSLIRVSQNSVSNNTNIPLVKRDYYFNNNYIVNQ